MSRCVVLLSGGLDSATTLAVAKSLGFELYALTVLYGQRHSAEIAAARRVAEAVGVAEHRMMSVGLDKLGGSALTDDIEVPKDRVEMGDIPVTYVPARNLIFLSLAAAYAEVVDAHDLFLGVNAIDYSGYPDCRPEFLQAFEKAANLGTKAGAEGRGLRVHAPLVDLTKAQIIQRAMALGLDLSLTHSCYDPDPSGTACGHCDSCLIRKRAFEELGMRDPALP